MILSDLLQGCSINHGCSNKIDTAMITISLQFYVLKFVRSLLQQVCMRVFRTILLQLQYDIQAVRKQFVNGWSTDLLRVVRFLRV